MSIGPSIPESDVLPQPSKPEEVAMHNALRDFIQRTNDNLQFFIQLPVVTVTTTYTATSGDYTILCDATSAAFTVNLPKAKPNIGRVFIIKKTDSSGNGITLDGNGSETVEGSATYTGISSQFKSAMVHSDGSNWHILGTT